MITTIKYDVIYRKREGHANNSRKALLKSLTTRKLVYKLG